MLSFRSSRSAVALAATVLSLVAFQAPSRGEEAKTVRLPGAAAQMCAGAGGRMLIFHLRQLKQLAIVDLAAGRIVHAVPLASDDVCFAAGQDYLMVAFTGQKLLHRWNLKTFQREKTVPIPLDAVNKIAMGSGSAGPLLLLPGSMFIDPATMRPIAVQGGTVGGDQVRVSADGQTFLGWGSGTSPLHFGMMQLDGRKSTTRDGWSEGYNGAWLIPSADGSLIFRYGGIISTSELKGVAAESFKGAVLMPTDSPAFFLAMRAQANAAGNAPGRPAPRGNKGGFSQVEICTTADCRSLCTVQNLERMTSAMIPTGWGYFQGEPRVRYLPHEKVLATVPETDDSVVIRHLDLREELKRSGEPFLVVVSKPAFQAEPGGTYNYAMDVLSAAGGVKYSLESAPEGMTVSAKGKLSWKVPESASGSNVPVVVTIADAGGKEVFHSFTISVVGGPQAVVVPSRTAQTMPQQGKPAQPPKRGGSVAAAPRTRTRTRPGAAPPKPAAGPAEVTKADGGRLALPGGDCLWAPGQGYRSMLVLHADRLAILGPDGISISKQVKLPKAYSHIAERAGIYVALAVEPKAVEVIDKKTLKVVKSLKLSCTEFSDLALHPSRPISYVAMKDLGKHPTYQFIVFDEKSGEGHEGEDYVGTWIRPDPKGRFLMVGYRDIYEKGSRLLVNPDRVDVVPEYGDISWLIRYSLNAEGLPAESEIKQKAGGNAQGIRLSKDGRRVTFLSHVGYPEFSGNLAGWDPKDLKKIPVTYATKGKATTYDLAYHPMLPIVASPGSGSAVFFDRETGDIQENRLDLPDDALAGAKVHSVQFSPDGKNLIFHVTSSGGNYLVKAGLRLNPAELRTVEAEWKRPDGADEGQPESSGEKVALKEFDALKGGPGKAMATRDIGHWFMDSVVVIRGEDTAGTGFFVGSHGYLVTCAHCVPHGGKTTISYRETKDGQTQTRTAEPKVLAMDADRDLALLKIDASRSLRPIRLLADGKVESGERVAVIGNPGLGATILEYTMTEGIVSSAKRTLDDQSFIQTSAQVNPGSSGAPLFNANGLVIGMVSLKGRIEGAGFAIPADDVTAFLLRSASAKGADGGLTRRWTDRTGLHQIEATCKGLDPNGVKLEKPDGQVIALPLEKLSERDQEFIRRIRADLTGEEKK
jgi:S1-C subfamily serine protease